MVVVGVGGVGGGYRGHCSLCEIRATEHTAD